MIIGIVLLVIILIVLGYFIYNYYTNKKSMKTSKLLIPYIHDASIDKVFTNSNLPVSLSGNEYNINMWVYVNNYTYRQNEDKCILFKGLITGKLNGINDRQEQQELQEPQAQQELQVVQVQQVLREQQEPQEYKVFKV